jgi:hypothetical protein
MADGCFVETADDFSAKAKKLYLADPDKVAFVLLGFDNMAWSIFIKSFFDRLGLV